jgi:hypothetical protein
MKDLLKAADLNLGQINNVPMSTMHGLESRGLISSEWRMAMSRVVQTTTGGSFPTYRRVPLTADGYRAAKSLNGIRS